MSLGGGEIAGIAIGSILGVVILVVILLFLLRRFLRGPTKGSDNPKQLDGKVVAITGKNH